jgi:hypothetical protein
MDDQADISWNDSLETLIAQEAERCTGLTWLHTECERIFSIRTNWIALPVIILSTLNGFLSGSSQVILTNATLSSIGVGAVSLFTGAISTVGTYFSWAKRTEAHRISAIQYQKLGRFLSIELTLPKKERIQAKDILKILREQMERLMEISPAIPEFVLEKYKIEFKDISGIAHPDVISGLQKVVINKDVDVEEDKTSKNIVLRSTTPGIKVTLTPAAKGTPSS